VTSLNKDGCYTKRPIRTNAESPSCCQWGCNVTVHKGTGVHCNPQLNLSSSTAICCVNNTWFCTSSRYVLIGLLVPIPQAGKLAVRGLSSRWRKNSSHHLRYVHTVSRAQPSSLPTGVKYCKLRIMRPMHLA